MSSTLDTMAVFKPPRVNFLAMLPKCRISTITLLLFSNWDKPLLRTQLSISFTRMLFTCSDTTRTLCPRTSTMTSLCLELASRMLKSAHWLLSSTITMLISMQFLSNINININNNKNNSSNNNNNILRLN